MNSILVWLSMEEYSRRAASGLVISRKAPNLAVRDSNDNTKERNGQVCSRAGCSSKPSSMKAVQIGSPNKAKTLRIPFRSSGHGKEIVGSSSRTPVAVNTLRKSFSDSKRTPPSQVETYSESSCLHEESDDVSESSSMSGKAEMIVRSQPNSYKHSGAGSSSSGPSNRLVKRNSPRFVGSSASSTLKPGSQGARNNGASTSRYNLKSLRCNSSSDVVPPGCLSPIEPNLGKKRDNGRKRIGEPESSSSARGKNINGSTDERRNDNYNRGISISDSRRSRTLSPSGYGETANLRARRSDARTRLSNQESRTRLPLVESPLMTPSPSSPHRDMTLDAMTFSSENQFSTQIPSHRASSFSRPGSSSDTWPNRSTGPYEVGISRNFVNRDALRQYNLDGIAEMLLALDRIEQEEEPSYEQLLVLETSLFLGGLAYHDQHREMRLDIDNMSYEELLALEERMGTVSTALSEEDLAKCLKRSIYQGTTDRREGGDDVKCCVCQEEYADGHEVGRLKCDHGYHVECIHQWLRIKNWCPICKSSAASPSVS